MEATGARRAPHRGGPSGARDEAEELAAAILAGEAPAFDPYTGARPGTGGTPSPGARAGLEAPRYCQICGRRMVVQILPHGWRARCSRHGAVESRWLER